jgi:hypothetical protein
MRLLIQSTCSGIDLSEKQKSSAVRGQRQDGTPSFDGRGGNAVFQSVSREGT